VWIGRYRVAGKDSAKVIGKAWTKRSRSPAGYLTRSARALEIWFSLARILVMSETLSLAAVKARFSELVDRVERQQDRVIVTRNGKPAAVLISPDDLESLEETLAIMSDRSLTAQIRESEKAAAAGEGGVELDELRADLERRRAART
jgi:prevent-host-death family protein